MSQCIIASLVGTVRNVWYITHYTENMPDSQCTHSVQEHYVCEKVMNFIAEHPVIYFRAMSLQ